MFQTVSWREKCARTKMFISLADSRKIVGGREESKPHKNITRNKRKCSYYMSHSACPKSAKTLILNWYGKREKHRTKMFTFVYHKSVWN
jgi:hypothetical protein